MKTKEKQSSQTLLPTIACHEDVGREADVVDFMVVVVGLALGLGGRQQSLQVCDAWKQFEHTCQY